MLNRAFLRTLRRPVGRRAFGAGHAPPDTSVQNAVVGIPMGACILFWITEFMRKPGSYQKNIAGLPNEK